MTRLAKQGAAAGAAREAALRLDHAQAIGRQLSLLPVEASPESAADLAPAKKGRPAGSRNKATSPLRQMLAARGMRMPEDVVGEVAGLGQRDVTLLELAMQRAEQVAAWLEGEGGVPIKRDQRLGLFLAIWKEQASAAAALLPYGLPKLTPDAGGSTTNVLVMPGSADPGDRARVIEGRSEPRFGPPPMPGENEQDQSVSDADPVQSDGNSRTEGEKR